MKVTTKKKNANRRNAKKSTGPKSKSGKSAVALNGTVHGLRSVAPVLPGIEKAEDWEAHQNAMVERLSPEGAIEHALADRVALGFWRLARCSSAEGRIFDALRHRERWRCIGNKMSLENLKRCSEPAEPAFERLVIESEQLSQIAELWGRIDSGKVLGGVVANTACCLIDKITTVEDWQKLEESFNETFSWPPPQIGQLRKMVEWLAQQLSQQPKTWLLKQARDVQEEARQAEERITRLRRTGDDAEILSLLDPEITEKLSRYETTIHRALMRDLHELQRIQAMRLGMVDAVPMAVDVTMDA